MVIRSDHHNVDDEGAIKELMSVELTNAMFRNLYEKLGFYGTTPVGGTNQSDLETAHTDRDAIVALPGLLPELQMIYDDWRYFRLDQLSLKQLAMVFQMVEFTLNNDVDTIMKITRQIKIVTFTDEGALELCHSGIFFPPNEFDKLGQYIAKILDAERLLGWGSHFVSLMALEFELELQVDGLKDRALRELTYAIDEIIACSNYLGFHKAALSLTKIYGEPLESNPGTPRRCAPNYGARRSVYLNRSTDSNGDKKISVSFVALQSSLPQYLTLPESAFEDKALVDILVSQ
ncbi:hypothetical protein H4R33_003453 [Dimargaris cristalligena]|nr:hypothetical protein H4R33_003453 [Dimargaris cristalligena]